MRVDGSLKSLLQGVSQQPIRDRLEGQCTEQVNMSSDPVTGLARRAPSDLVGGLVSTSQLQGWHNFETRTGHKFIAAFHDGTVTVRNYAGESIPVTAEADVDLYLGANNGRLVCGTVENQVLISNTSVVAKMAPGFKGFANKGPSAYPSGILQVLGGQYGRDYTVTLNGSLIASYRPPDGSSAPHVHYLRTSVIALRLYQAMTETGGIIDVPDGQGSSINKTGALAPGSGYDVTRYDDLILIRRTADGTEFSLNCSDDAGNVNMKAMTDQVPDQADLPRVAPQGYLARVATETDPDDDLFLEFKLEKPNEGAAIGTGFGQAGYWQESISSSVTYQVDRATMPHVLEWDPEDESFTLRQGNWKDRRVGTDGSNPEPSFMGNTINDIATFQSRLVFLAGSYVCMSRTNRFEDFWMGSAAALVDSDPVDISSTAVEASMMLAAVPHNRDLVIFSQKGQFVTFGRSAVTPANAALVLTTAFESELAAKPQPAGRNIFFATNYGRFTGVREFFTEGNSDINDTRPVTQHIKKYMKGRVRKLSSSANYDTLLVHTEEDRNKVYVYQYLWQDSEKLQSSWSHWKYDYPVEWSFFDEEVVYMILKDGNDYFLYRQSLDAVDEDDVGYVIHLDSRFNVDDCYSSFVLPYNRLQNDWDNRLMVVQSTGCPNPGMNVPIRSVVWDDVNDYWVVTLKYDLGGGSAVVGTKYRSSYRPTMPQVKDKDKVVMATGKLRVKHFIISLNETGDINGIMYSDWGDSEVVSFQGRIVGGVDNLIGKPALSNEKFVMPFRQQTDRADIELFTDSFMPMCMLDIEWIGQFTKRGRRIDTGGTSS